MFLFSERHAHAPTAGLIRHGYNRTGSGLCRTAQQHPDRARAAKEIMKDAQSLAAKDSSAVSRSGGAVTRLIHAANEDKSAAEELLPLVYEQLLAIARQRMRHEDPNHTLQATALVHEVYLRLVGNEAVSWPSRVSFFHAAAQAMRRILIDHARKRGRIKRGGGAKRQPLDAIDLAASDDTDCILALDAAIEKLNGQDPRAGSIVELRFYAGLSVEDTARTLGLSERTVKREWAFARAWLYKELAL